MPFAGSHKPHILGASNLSSLQEVVKEGTLQATLCAHQAAGIIGLCNASNARLSSFLLPVKFNTVLHSPKALPMLASNPPTTTILKEAKDKAVKQMSRRKILVSLPFTYALANLTNTLEETKGDYGKQN